MLTDDTGAVVWDASYRPFGEAAVSGSVAFNLRFRGQYFDAETGLAYNYYRDYDAALGRYLESDPIGLRGGWNTYAYVGGNPVMRVDPEGLAMGPPQPALDALFGNVGSPGYQLDTGCYKDCVFLYSPTCFAVTVFGFEVSGPGGIAVGFACVIAVDIICTENCQNPNLACGATGAAASTG